MVFALRQRYPYRATSCRAILHSDSTYDSLRQRYATGRRLLLAQCFTRLVADQRRTASIAIVRKSRVILYDRAVNLSVLIRNSTVQEMNPTPSSSPFPSHFGPSFSFPIMFNVTVQFHFFLLCLFNTIHSQCNYILAKSFLSFFPSFFSMHF